VDTILSRMTMNDGGIRNNWDWRIKKKNDFKIDIHMEVWKKQKILKVEILSLRSDTFRRIDWILGQF
jgi:hypothetical protein